jgi:hypothetical protein
MVLLLVQRMAQGEGVQGRTRGAPSGSSCLCVNFFFDGQNVLAQCMKAAFDSMNRILEPLKFKASDVCSVALVFFFEKSLLGVLRVVGHANLLLP